MNCLKVLSLFFAAGLNFLPETAEAAQIIENIHQTTPVRGNITDLKGEPIIGATIYIKGTTIGTITDFEGNYTLNAHESGTLVISCVGYITQEIYFAPGQIINISLKESEVDLEEVVVVGYGVQRKSDVTGSVTSVDSERLSKLPVTNIMQAVQGAAAGITVTQSSSIPGEEPLTLIRGRNSINAGTSPYVVVDGIPISKSGGSLNDINPNDIESVEILKDASATAIYGTNGANGVLLITTKSGIEGKPKVTYNGYFGVETFSKKLNFCNGEQISQRYRDYVAQNPGETMFNDFVKNEAEAANQAAGIETDWIYDMVSQTGVIQDHNVTISGGFDNIHYYVSGDYMDEKGILKGYNYRRFSFRTNIDAEVTNYLKVGTNSYIVSHNKDGGRVNFLMAETMSPYGQVYETDGSYCIYPMASEKLFFNPMRDVNQDHERRSWNINLNGFAEIDFGKMASLLSGLNYRFNLGYAFIPERNAYFNGVEQDNLNGGYGYIFNAETQSFTAENIIGYNKDFLDYHHLDLTLLYASGGRKYHKNEAAGEKFINEDLLWHNLGSAETQTSTSYSDKYNSVSQMCRINYSYASRYLFTFTVRRDGSSVFGSDNKFGVFPSVALGWNISSEKFMENFDEKLNALKLRISYGKAGNEAISVYRTIGKMDNGPLAMDGKSTSAIWANNEMGNSGLSWETTKTINLGIDFGLYQNRFAGTIDVYKSNTSDLLLNRNLPKVSGYQNVMTNIGETQNIGIEFTLNTHNIDKAGFLWQTSLVFSANQNKIIDLYGDGKDDIGNRWFIGEPIGVVYDYEMVGIWQDDEINRGEHLNWDPEAQAGDVKLRDINGDGKITPEEDKTIQGQTTPKWTAGLTNTFMYKGFTLSVFITTVQGVKQNNPLLAAAADEMGRRNFTTEIGYWTPENRSNEYRSLSKTSNRNGYNYPSDASFTRIKDVTLSYTFPQRLSDAMHLGSVTLYATGRNLATFTKWVGWDPEVVLARRGYSNYERNYPMTKSVIFGMNITF